MSIVVSAEEDERRRSSSQANGGTWHRASSSSSSSSSQPTHWSTNKRSLSPPDELHVDAQDSKRTKSFEDDELSQLLDHRQSKHNSSQGSVTSIPTRASVENEPRKATLRKPTIRKLNTSQQKPSRSLSPRSGVASFLISVRLPVHPPRLWRSS